MPVPFLTRLCRAAAMAVAPLSSRPLRRAGTAAACVLAAAGATGAQAQLVERATWEGPYGYAVTGSSARTQSNLNNGNACAVTTTPPSASLSSIPANATLVAAYLYWARSGNTADPSIIFNGTAVTPEATETEPFDNGDILNFSGAVRNVTALVAATGTGNGNGTYTISDFQVSNGAPWCGVEAVMGSWSLVVVYREPGATPKRVSLRDGMLAIRNRTESITLNGFTGAATSNVRLTYIVHEGDPDQDGERVRWNTSNTNVATDQFNSSTGNGLDIDTYTPTLASGASNAQLHLTSGADLVLAQAVITSIATTTTRGVDVLPNGLAQPVQRLPGTGYSQVFTVTNTGNVDDTYNLILSGTGNPLFAQLDSVRATGIVLTSRLDSARLAIPSGTTAQVTFWYTVPPGPTADNTGYLRARSAAQATVLDDGWAQVRRVSPRLTITKSVTPQNTLSPGTELTYTMLVTNVGDFAARNVIVTDSVPPQVAFKIGSPTQTLPGGVTATRSYSSNGGTSFNYTPGTGTCPGATLYPGYDPCVTHVRWTLTGDLPSGATGNAGTFRFLARIK